LSALLQLPVEKRILTAEQTADCIAALKGRSSLQVAHVILLLLAWADDQDSADAIHAYAKHIHKDNSLLKGVVSYALGIRDMRKMKKDYYTGLCDAVRDAKNPWELLFYANRL